MIEASLPECLLAWIVSEMSDGTFHVYLPVIYKHARVTSYSQFPSISFHPYIKSVS